MIVVGETSPGLPVRNAPNAPNPMATTRSRIPNTFQATKVLLFVKLGLLIFRMSKGAVTPMNMSPTAAGHAK